MRAYEEESIAREHNSTVAGFFAFTSLNRLCFSRCSHFPFATDGMPMVMPLGDERYAVVVKGRRDEGDVDMAITAIERVLAEVDDAPWHGIDAEALIAPINQQLAARGSSLRLGARQRLQWLDVLVASDAGRVKVGVAQRKAYCELLFDAAPDKEPVRARSAAEAAEQIIAWLGAG